MRTRVVAREDGQDVGEARGTENRQLRRLRRNHHLQQAARKKRQPAVLRHARRNRSALPTTDAEDRHIASAATFGDACRPTDAKAPAATGMPSAL